MSVHHRKMLGLSAGCFSHGEMEDSNPWGPDLLPYACTAGDAGCLYQVGYVSRECQMQSVSQERYAFVPTEFLPVQQLDAVTSLLCYVMCPCSLSLWLYFKFWMSGFTVSSIDLSETFDPDSSKPFLCSQYCRAAIPWIFRVLGQKSSTNPSGNICATVHSLVSFLE